MSAPLSGGIRAGLLAGAALSALAAGAAVILGLAAILGAAPAIWLACGFGLVFLGLVIATILLRHRLWRPCPERAARRDLHRALSARLRILRRAARSIDRDPLRVPRLLVLAPAAGTASSTMADLGFAPLDPGTADGALPELSLWSSQTAVALHLAIPEAEAGAAAPGCTEAVIRALAADRPLQPANAAVVDLPLDRLVAAGEEACIAAIRRHLAAATERFGTELPIHVTLCGLERVPDLMRAALMSGEGGQPVLQGSFLLEDGPLPERLAEIFEALRRQLGHGQIRALRGQLDPDFSADVVTAPFQLSVLERRLVAALTALIAPLPPRTEPQRIASIGFVGRIGDRGGAGLDPLAATLARRYLRAPVASRAPAAAAMAHNGAEVAAMLHREAFAAAPNRRRRARRGILATATNLALAALVAGAALGTAHAALTARQIDRDVAARFDAYFRQVDALDPGADTIVDRVLLLDTLARALDGYRALDRPLVAGFLIGSRHRDFYRAVYHDELAEGLQRALADQLEKDIFAFNALADPVALLDLERVKTRFFGDQAAHLGRLKAYFTRTMIEQGEVSASFLSAFDRVSSDLFALDRPLERGNAELDTVVADTLRDGDIATLLYRALMSRPEMKARVDLTAAIGPRFAAVFALPDGATAQFVPRGFTGPGFADMFEGGEIAGLAPLLDDYAAVIGPLPATARNAVARRIRQRYVADYIGRWSDFLAALEFRRAETWVDGRRLIEALTIKTDNPIDRLDAMLSDNLAPRLPDAPAEGAGGAAANAPALTASGAAANIAAAFAPYVAAEDDGASAFGLFLERSRAVGEWMQAAGSAVGGAPAFLFAEHAALGDRPNPLADLDAFAAQTDLPLLAGFARDLARTLDTAATAIAMGHVDAVWRDRIVEPWGPLISGRFPFDRFGAADFPLKDLPAAFGAEGAFTRFEATYLSGFRDAGGGFAARPSFVPGHRVALSDRAARLFRQVGDIRRTLLPEGIPALGFRLRARHLDARLSEVRISAGTTLYRYRHGPVQWSRQSWPDPGTGRSDLQAVLYARGRPQQSVRFDGPWAWFRLAAAGGAARDPGGSVLAVIGPSGQQAALEFGTELTDNPFGMDFFGGFTIPPTLFDPDPGSAGAPLQ